ncbi:MAG: hypothetical protein L6R40_008401 [Gallowayella cf. fulva]|nr:MAG: hypothetical protein L6R40_008401 [Xanthomendoza cf. fulva]
MDLLYTDYPPGWQILHCLDASTQGGESLFSDALRAILQIKASRPDHYAILEEFPVTYKYRNNNEWYQQTRPHIENVSSPHKDPHLYISESLEGSSSIPAIKAINWSPPFQAPFLFNIGGDASFSDSTRNTHGQNQSEAFHRYFDAIRNFKGQLEAGNAVFETKMEPGTAVIFDNRRIVHARRAFEKRGGARWLRGAYVDADAFRSRLNVLAESKRNDRTSKK